MSTPDRIPAVRLTAAALTPPPELGDNVLSRRELIAGLAISFSLPIYPRQINASSEHVPTYLQAGDVNAALTLAENQIQELGRRYMLPTTDSEPVQVHALALWRDAAKLRTSVRNTSLMDRALSVEANAAIMIGHIFAEGGQMLDARSWFRRAGDAASVMWPQANRAPSQEGANLRARAELLQCLDLGKHLTAPADALTLAKRHTEGTTGPARGMALAVWARAESIMPSAAHGESARHALVESGKWAQIESAPDTPLSLLCFTPRQHDYVAAGVYANLGIPDKAREHHASYHHPSLPKAGFMNSVLLDLGGAETLLRSEGPAAAAASVHQTLASVPAERRSAPVRDKGVAMVTKLHNMTRRGGVPQEVEALGQYVRAMFDPAYLGTAASSA